MAASRYPYCWCQYAAWSLSGESPGVPHAVRYRLPYPTRRSEFQLHSSAIQPALTHHFPVFTTSMPPPLNRLRLLLVIPHLGGGGAEQVTSHLAQFLPDTVFEKHLAVLTPDRPGARTPPPEVRLHRIRASRVRAASLPLLQLIRAVRPNLLLSNMAHLNWLILLLKPLLPRETRILIRQNATVCASALSWAERLGYQLLYPRADAILCQSLQMAGSLADGFAIPVQKLAVLANPIDVEGIRRLAAETLPTLASSPVLVAAGRLAPEKGHSQLLRAFATVRRSYPQATLKILGEGPLRQALEAEVHALGLEDWVRLLGHVATPAIHYGEATLFVQPSLEEGIPNALLEAAAAGLPIVATPSSQGLAALLQNQQGIWLTRACSALALAETILCALNHLCPSTPGTSQAPRRFEHGFFAPFALPTAIGAYERLLTAVAGDGSLPRQLLANSQSKTKPWPETWPESGCKL